MAKRHSRFLCAAVVFGALAHVAAQPTPPAAPPAEVETEAVPPAPAVETDEGESATTDVPPAPFGTPEVKAAGGTTSGAKKPAPKPSPPPTPWKPLFFENDFSAYVGKEPYVLGEEIKQMPLDLPGDELDFTLSVGGQVRHRYMNETDRIRPGGPGKSTYDLWRWRQYYDLKNDYVRLYVETIEADSFGEDLPETAIDVNRFDLLNAFVDLTAYDDDFGKGTFRYGRQELLYGKQRLLSPLDWANARRNFQGYKFWHAGEGWRFDAFAVNPVNAVARGTDFARFDSQPDEADHRRTLFGGYLTMTGNPQMSADVYMLYQDDERPRPNFAEGDRGLNGARVYGVLPAGGEARAWDYDVEGGYQWGSDLGRRVSAEFATAELGHTWKKAAWSPRLAGLVYYGSGGATDNGTFYTYYPLNHAYWGIIDNLSGQNLIDLSPQWGFNPSQKLNVTGAWHYFLKADAGGFLYNVAQTPAGPPGFGNNIGSELDLVATYTLNPNFNVQAGWAKFWYGSYVERALPRDDAEFFYVQTTFNY